MSRMPLLKSIYCKTLNNGFMFKPSAQKGKPPEFWGSITLILSAHTLIVTQYVVP